MQSAGRHSQGIPPDMDHLPAADFQRSNNLTANAPPHNTSGDSSNPRLGPETDAQWLAEIAKPQHLVRSWGPIAYINHTPPGFENRSTID